MINQVRSAVMDILNKDKRGYLSPEQFNTLSEMVQTEIYTDYFNSFSNHQNKLFKRLENSGSSNISNQLEQIIERFMTSKPLILDVITGKYPLPGTGTGSQSLYPTTYKIVNIYNPQNEIELVDSETARLLLRSNRVAPTDNRPIYWLDEQGINIRPQPAIQNVIIEYLRFPKAPRWTFTMVADNPLFNPSSSTYQDFELPESDMPTIVVKILQYAGVSIRESDVVELMQRDEMMEKQAKI